MVYQCIRCNYQTDHLNYIINHLNKKNKCLMNYFLLINDEEQIKLSSISIYNLKIHNDLFLNYRNKCLNKGFKDIKEFLDIYNSELFNLFFSKENKRIKDKIRKKYYICMDCGLYFNNKSNLTRHIYNNSCSIKNFYQLNMNNNIINEKIYMENLFNKPQNIFYNDKLIFEEMEKGYLNFIIYKLKNDKIENNLFFIEYIESNYLIIIENNTFCRVLKDDYFVLWLKKTYDEFELVFENISHLFEWKVLKKKYDYVKNDYLSFFQSNDIKLNWINEWSKQVFINNILFINFALQNKNNFTNFLIKNNF